MAEDDALPKPAAMSGIVPHFYYDVLGRIVPGAYLLITAYWLVQLNGRALEV